MTSEHSMRRREVVSALLADRGDLLVVSGLGSTTYDCAAAGDHPLNFYLWGAMGGAAMIGLGLALAQPKRRVLVITGDGEMLMGLGSLATIATRRPANLAIAVIDNERYGETGMQATHTAAGIDLAGMARAAGFIAATTVARQDQLDDAIKLLRREPGPVLAVIKVAAARDPFVLPARDGALLKHRLRAALLGEAAAY
jgi:thiamine pyrophosphate-dependent acetolactate synthase large subunit-like protein